MAAITGAFLAGLIFARSPAKERIESGISTLAYGFFVPVFFVNVGLAANARMLTSQSFWLLLAMVFVAVISKVVGSGLGARLAGFSNREALQIGAGMTSRGEVGLIVATVGVAEGLIGAEIFAVIVGVVIVTTLLTPAMLRSLFSKNNAIV
jgi:Kef-type K+ transport system membrane component KefB